MKRLGLTVLFLAVGLVAAGKVWADADVEVFGENVQQLDASLNMRRTTTEQFDPIRGQSVLNRPRPDFDPVPISLYSFQLFPALNVGPYYDSNIFASRVNTNDDVIWKVNPTVSLLSDWGRHAIGITALGDLDWYTNNPKQSYKGGAVQAEGRYDLAEQTWLSGVTGFQRVTELKGSPASPGNAVGASQYNLWTAGGEFYRGVGQLKMKMDYDYGYYQYDPLQIIGGGSVNQDSRNRNQNKVSGELTYDYTENFQPFMRVGLNSRDYIETVGSPRSSDGYQVDAGTRMDFGGITTAEAYLGWISQNYYNFGTGVVAGPDFGGDVLWNMTELTSLETKVQRSIEETTLAGASSYLDSEVSMTLAHELRRDIILQGTLTYDGIDYQGFRRHDDYYNIGAAARYYIDRHFYTDFTYGFQRRTSDQIGNDYDRHTILLRVGAQY